MCSKSWFIRIHSYAYFDEVGYDIISWHTPGWDVFQCIVSATQHCTVQYHTIYYCMVQRSTAQCSEVQCSSAQYNTVQHIEAQHSPVQHSAVQHSTIQQHKIMTPSTVWSISYPMLNKKVLQCDWLPGEATGWLNMPSSTSELYCFTLCSPKPHLTEFRAAFFSTALRCSELSGVAAAHGCNVLQIQCSVQVGGG